MSVVETYILNAVSAVDVLLPDIARIVVSYIGTTVASPLGEDKRVCFAIPSGNAESPVMLLYGLNDWMFVSGHPLDWEKMNVALACVSSLETWPDFAMEGFFFEINWEEEKSAPRTVLSLLCPALTRPGANAAALLACPGDLKMNKEAFRRYVRDALISDEPYKANVDVVPAVNLETVFATFSGTLTRLSANGEGFISIEDGKTAEGCFRDSVPHGMFELHDRHKLTGRVFVDEGFVCHGILAGANNSFLHGALCGTFLTPSDDIVIDGRGWAKTRGSGSSSFLRVEIGDFIGSKAAATGRMWDLAPGGLKKFTIRDNGRVVVERLLNGSIAYDGTGKLISDKEFKVLKAQCADASDLSCHFCMLNAEGSSHESLTADDRACLFANFVESRRATKRTKFSL